VFRQLHYSVMNKLVCSLYQWDSNPIALQLSLEKPAGSPEHFHSPTHTHYTNKHLRKLQSN